MKILEKQLQHLIALVVLLAGVVWIARDDFLAGEFMGLSTKAWLWVSIAVPIVHQVYVWLAWRLELHYGLIQKWLGPRAFPLYCAGFAILFLARPLTVIGLAIADRGTLPLAPWIGWVLAVVCFIPSAYLGYSVVHYFGIERAFGIDHFDPTYRDKPFVRQGIFRWTSNAMYKFGFLALWVPGFLLLSEAALLAALFNHLYIWVHYYFTELPDIRHIYKTSK
jgi:hypothetical protein